MPAVAKQLAPPTKEPSASPLENRMGALDGLRGVAILLVVICHYCGHQPTVLSSPTAYFVKLTRFSWSGVDCFFVLSGFLIARCLYSLKGQPKYFSQFYLRRFSRIVPLYYAFLVAAMILFPVVAVPDGLRLQTHAPWWMQFTFLQNLWMAWVRDYGTEILGTTWSLGLEEQSYLVLPVLIWTFGKKSFARILVLTLFALPVLRIVHHYASNEYFKIHSLFFRFDGIALGALCFLLVEKFPPATWASQHKKGLVAGIGVVAMALFYLTVTRADLRWAGLYSIRYTFVAFFFAGLLLATFSHPESFFTRLMNGKFLRALGIVSYGVYLFHSPINWVMHQTILNSPPKLLTVQAHAVTIAAFFLSFALAGLSWKYFEKPLFMAARKR